MWCLGSSEAKLPAWGIAGRRGHGRYSADCCLIARQPAGSGEALADRQWCDRNLSCSAFVFFFRRKCSREQSRACKGYSLKCDKGMTNHIFSFDEIWTRKNLTTFGLHPVTTLFKRGTECEYIHSKGNCPLFQMPYLAKSYDASVVSYLTWKLGVTFFLNHPVYTYSELDLNQMSLRSTVHDIKLGSSKRECPTLTLDLSWDSQVTCPA